MINLVLTDIIESDRQYDEHHLILQQDDVPCFMCSFHDIGFFFCGYLKIKIYGTHL